MKHLYLVVLMLLLGGCFNETDHVTDNDAESQSTVEPMPDPGGDEGIGSQEPVESGTTPQESEETLDETTTGSSEDTAPQDDTSQGSQGSSDESDSSDMEPPATETPPVELSRESFPSYEHFYNLVSDMREPSELNCWNDKLNNPSWTNHVYLFTEYDPYSNPSHYNPTANDFSAGLGDYEFNQLQYVVVSCAEVPKYARPIVERDNNNNIPGIESAVYYVRGAGVYVLYVQEDLSRKSTHWAMLWMLWHQTREMTGNYHWNTSFARALWFDAWGSL